MSSLDSTFAELLAKIRDPEALNPAKSDPIFYFVFPPDEMLELKKRIPRWTTKLSETGFKVHRISLADALWRLVDESGRWNDWLDLEPDAETEDINKAVSDVLTHNNALVMEIENAVRQASADTVILLTETELLHPYFRTRSIESWLHDKVQSPTVIFYPGRRAGQYGLHFLNFYTVDGNYRSTLLGGI